MFEDTQADNVVVEDSKVPEYLMVEIRILADILRRPWVLSGGHGGIIDTAALREFALQSALVQNLAEYLIQNADEFPLWMSIYSAVMNELADQALDKIGSLGDLSVSVDLLKHFEVQEVSTGNAMSLYTIWVESEIKAVAACRHLPPRIMEEVPDLEELPSDLHAVFSEILDLLRNDWVRTDSHGVFRIRVSAIKLIRAHIQNALNLRHSIEDEEDQLVFDRVFAWIGRSYTQKLNELAGLNLSTELLWMQTISGGEQFASLAVFRSIQLWKAQGRPSVVRFEEDEA
jgi:hypothetical protein